MGSKVSGANYGAIRKIGLMGARLNAKPPKRRPYGYDDDEFDDTTKRDKSHNNR